MKFVSDHLDAMYHVGELAGALRRLGIVAGHPTLKDSASEPMHLVAEAESELRLLVHHGSKFVKPDAFMELMKRQKPYLRVRMLVHRDMREGERARYEEVAHALRPRRATDRHRFVVRLYDHTPDFRLVFVDTNYVSLSHYAAEADERESGSDDSWLAPHLIVSAQGGLTEGLNYSLHRVLDRLWYERWDTAEEFIPNADAPGGSPRSRRNLG